MSNDRLNDLAALRRQLAFLRLLVIGLMICVAALGYLSLRAPSHISLSDSEGKSLVLSPDAIDLRNAAAGSFAVHLDHEQGNVVLALRSNENTIVGSVSARTSDLSISNVSNVVARVRLTALAGGADIGASDRRGDVVVSPDDVSISREGIVRHCVMGPVDDKPHASPGQ